jgi:hypothetical protein
MGFNSELKKPLEVKKDAKKKKECKNCENIINKNE